MESMNSKEFKEFYADKDKRQAKRSSKRGVKQGNPFRKKKNKYNARTCKCIVGHIHDSRDESRYCDILHLRVKAGDIRSYSIQKVYPLPRNGKTLNRVRFDFLVTNNDESVEIHEYKGFFTALAKLKYNWFRCEYPEMKLLIKTKGDLWT